MPMTDDGGSAGGKIVPKWGEGGQKTVSWKRKEESRSNLFGLPKKEGKMEGGTQAIEVTQIDVKEDVKELNEHWQSVLRGENSKYC